MLPRVVAIVCLWVLQACAGVGEYRMEFDPETLQQINLGPSGTEQPPSLAPTRKPKKPKKEKPKKGDSVQQFKREYHQQWEADQRSRWDLPDEEALWQLNKCAICEATALVTGESVLRWYVKETARLKQAAKEKMRKMSTELDYSSLADEIESACADRKKWETAYRQKVINVGGQLYHTILGPGIEPLPGKEKKPLGLNKKMEFAQFEAMASAGMGGGAGQNDDDEIPLSEEMVNTMVKDCTSIVGSAEEEELVEAVIDAHKASEFGKSRHEDDTGVAEVVRKMLCKTGGSTAHCTVGALQRKHGYTVAPDTQKSKKGSKSRK